MGLHEVRCGTLGPRTVIGGVATCGKKQFYEGPQGPEDTIQKQLYEGPRGMSHNTWQAALLRGTQGQEAH